MSESNEAAETADDIQALVSGGKTADAAAATLIRYGASPEVVAEGRRIYEERVGIISHLREPPAVVSPSRERSWYGGPSGDSAYWAEFEKNLRASLPVAVVDEAMSGIDDATSRVLDLAGAPGWAEIRSKGMVLGYVQSGKTTNFMGVMAKAADAGYRLFIVLSGITDNLRSQTQERIEDVLVGQREQNWYLLTDLERDFSMSGNASNLLNEPSQRLIAVVKKNGPRLRRLNDWIKSAGSEVLKGLPIMLIDDEADQASLNAGRNGHITRINGLIGQIISHPKTAYVAYTATPFANLLTDPDRYESLYPDDFIVEMKQPVGYFGPERLFGREALSGEDDGFESSGLDVIRIIDPLEADLAKPPPGKGAVHDWWPTITPALRDSIDWFVLATAARRARWDEDKHSTMLIHTSMLSEAHYRMREPVEEYVDDLIANLDSDGAVMDRLERQWLDETDALPAKCMDLDEVPWTAVKARIPGVLNDLRVVVDNYRSTDRLYYRKGEATTAIVIGGNTLSRGLTLEGLVSSYFVRSASAYDTLLQMGRWFGYRTGYEDLPRIWMPEELAEWFADLATVEEEIRRDIRVFGPELRPKDVGVRIRTHPSMTVTSAAKMRNAVRASVNFGGEKVQTIVFEHRNEEWLRDNIEATRGFITSAIAECGAERLSKDGRTVIRGVPSDRILDFLSAYRMYPTATRTRSDLLTGYIRHQVNQGGLQSWNVVVMEMAQRPPAAGLDLGLGREVHPVGRSRMQVPTEHANIKTLVSVPDRIADVDIPVGELPRDVNPKDDRSLARYRQDAVGDVGLLVIYPIDKDSQVEHRRKTGGDGPRNTRVPLEAVDHVIGLGLFFPDAVGDPLYEYVSAAIFPEIEDEADDFEAIESADEAAAEATEEEGLGTSSSGEMASGSEALGSGRGRG